MSLRPYALGSSLLAVMTIAGGVFLAGCSQDRQGTRPDDSPPLPGQATESQTGGSENQPRNDTSRSQHVTHTSPPAFNGDRAFGYLTGQTSFGPRNPGSRGHALCLDYLATTLRSFAHRVRLQEFTALGYGNETLRLTNVIASFRPELTTRLLLCAHWDTRPRADRDPNPLRQNEPILGANDGASGVAVLLELASLLQSAPPPVGVDIVLFDGEDYGMEGDHSLYLLGSRHFARTRSLPAPPRFGILLDMVGDAYLEIPREGYSTRYAPDIVDLVWKTAGELGYHQFVNEPGPDVLDDHIPLNEAGIRTINIIDFDYPDPTNRFWHTHADTPENCSPASLQAVGDVLTRVVYSQRH